MHEVSKEDERSIDWSHTSEDYARFRPNYPGCFYDRLSAFGIGKAGQRILDLGTGVGFLAREFARRGATVTGIDVAPGQIAVATREAAREGLSIDFRTSPAESTGLASHSFDVITASQCWLYFDHNLMLPEIRRLLKAGGLFMTSHFCWLPRLDPVAKATEELILKHNPGWTASNWPGIIPPKPSWAPADFDLAFTFNYDRPIPFDHESWRGRIRACRGVSASLNPEEVLNFDQDHARLLRSLVRESFTVLHRIDAHAFRLGRATRVKT